jgi:hypothetical protein
VELRPRRQRESRSIAVMASVTARIAVLAAVGCTTTGAATKDGSAGTGGTAGTGAAGTGAAGTGAAGTGAAGTGTAGGTAGTGAAGTGVAGTGAAGTGAAGTGAAGSTSDGGVGCPTAAPFNANDPTIRDNCTKRIYLAGGDDFRLTASVDEGKTWQRVQPANIAGDDYVNDIAVKNGVVIVVGLPGLYTSVDQGRTFSLVGNVSHNSFDPYGGLITPGPDQVLLTDNGGTYASPNGLAWTAQIPFPDNSHQSGFGGHYHGHAFGNQTYVIFQDNNAVRTYDGKIWTESTLASVDFRAIVYATGKFVGVGSGPMGSGSATSTNGKDWTFQYKDAANANLAGQGCLTFDGTKFTMFAAGNSAYTSTDGVSWTKHAVTAGLEWVIFQEGAYFGVGAGKLWLSQDGLTWTSTHDFAANETSNINGSRLAVGRILK